MTGTDAPGSPGDPTQAPLTLELLADLHADLFDEPLATQLRRRVAADSQAAAVLTALDATMADLAALPHQRTTPIPEGVAHRLETTLAGERAGTDPALTAGWAAAAPALVTDMSSAVRRRRRAGWAGVAILAVAAAAIGVVALSGVVMETAGAGDALDTAIGIQASEPLALDRSNPASLHNALDQALKDQDYGPLSPPQRLRNCLTANGGGAPLGALEVTLEGRRGVLLVLPTDQVGQVRLLVVGPSCNSANPSRIADQLMIR
ncbi:MAG: hypothetical protein ACT4NY_18860 [Pseudonocardiales bacterium]